MQQRFNPSSPVFVDDLVVDVKPRLLVNIINRWNRIAIGFGGWAEPADVKAAAKAVAA